MRYHIEGWFEGFIDADSPEEAEENFTVDDIDDMNVTNVYETEIYVLENNKENNDGTGTE